MTDAVTGIIVALNYREAIALIERVEGTPDYKRAIKKLEQALAGPDRVA